MDIDYKSIGQRIRKYRTQKQFTQAKLAELAEQTPSNISHIERGVAKPSLQALVSIANALEVTADQLLCDSILYSQKIYSDELQSVLEDFGPYEKKAIVQFAESLREIRDYKKT